MIILLLFNFIFSEFDQNQLRGGIRFFEIPVAPEVPKKITITPGLCTLIFHNLVDVNINISILIDGEYHKIGELNEQSRTNGIHIGNHNATIHMSSKVEKIVSISFLSDSDVCKNTYITTSTEFHVIMKNSTNNNKNLCFWKVRTDDTEVSVRSTVSFSKEDKFYFITESVTESLKDKNEIRSTDDFVLVISTSHLIENRQLDFVVGYSKGNKIVLEDGFNSIISQGNDTYLLSSLKTFDIDSLIVPLKQLMLPQTTKPHSTPHNNILPKPNSSHSSSPIFLILLGVFMSFAILLSGFVLYSICQKKNPKNSDTNSLINSRESIPALETAEALPPLEYYIPETENAVPPQFYIYSGYPVQSYGWEQQYPSYQ